MRNKFLVILIENSRKQIFSESKQLFYKICFFIPEIIDLSEMIKGNLINASAEILLLSNIVMNISLKQT